MINNQGSNRSLFDACILYLRDSKILCLVIVSCLLFLGATPVAHAGIIIKSPAYLGLNSGLVGYWSFDAKDIYGTSVRDTSGGNFHGTNTGAIKKPGKLGQALEFSASNWSQVASGSGITAGSGVGSAIAKLNSTDVAFIDGTNDSLRTYRFDGTDWFLVGSGLTIDTTGNAPSLAALNSTDVAFIDNTNESLRTYRFNGTNWAQVGNSLAISSILATALATLNSTDVAFIDSSNDSLRTYRFNGTDWAQVGNGLSITAGDGVALTALNSTDVAFIDFTNDELRTYRFNGTDWAQVGNGLAISAVAAPALAALNSTDVAFIDSFNDELRTYRFNGTDWAQVGTSHAVAGTTGVQSLAALNSNDVALFDNSRDLLRTYRWTETPNTYVDVGAGPTSVKTIAFWVYPRTTTEYLINITGTTDYIWINAGVVTVTGAESPTIFIDGVRTSTITAGAWHYVVINLENDWSQVGNGLDQGSSLGTPTLATLNSTDIVLIGDIGDSIRTYRFDGSDWAQVGNGLEIGVNAGGTPTMTALNSSSVAITNPTNDSLRKYSFNGTDWAQAGNSLTITGIVGSAGLTALNSTDVALVDTNDDTLRTYRFNGTDWAQVGNSLSMPGIGSTDLATLNSTDVAFIDATNDNLRTYHFDGTDWTQVGNGLVISTTGATGLTALNSTDVAYTDSTNDRLRRFSFNGTDWTEVGRDFSTTPEGIPALTALNSTDVVLISDANDSLRTYRYGVAGGENASNLDFGRTVDANYTNALLDDIRMYSRSLSTTEVVRLSKIGLGSKTNQTSAVDLQSKGLVGHWTFDGPNISGTRAKDSSGLQNHGTLTNSPTTAQGKLGQSLDFTIGTDYVDVGSDASLRLTTGGTLSAWIKPDSFGTVPQYPRIIDKSSDVEGTGGYSFQINNNTIVAGLQILINGSGASSWCQSNANAVRLNVWQHVVAVMGSTGVATIYVNGVDVSNNATPCASGTQVPPNTALATRIGARGGANDREFDGSIDDVRVYNRALSVNEIKNLYNQAQSKFNSSQQSAAQAIDRGLIGYWNFDGPNISGTRAKDTSGNNQHGVIGSAVVRVMGKIGQALQFPGSTNSEVTIADNAIFNTSVITVSAWVRSNSSQLDNTFETAVARDSASGRDWILGNGSSDSTYRFTVFISNAQINAQSATGFSKFVWHHLVGTYDGTNLRLYVDGINTATTPTSGPIDTDPQAILIGFRTNSVRWYGKIDDVRVYNRALSQTEVTKLYNMGR